METKSFPRATPPHIPSLATALAPLLAVANAGSFHVFTGVGVTFVEQGGWAGVDLVAVQAAVDAAPEDSPELRARDTISDIPLWEKKVILTLLDLINVERARHGAAAITPAQFITSAKTR